LILGALAYSGSLQGPLIFDDPDSITDNPSIRTLWPLGPVLSPPANGTTVTGRPILNLSLALNYAAGGTEVRGYHVVNVCIHLLAGLTLFGVLRRTLESAPLRAQWGADAEMLAGVAALIWTVHPVQTESVTYIIQRAESLAGLFYLLTLYSLIRYAEEGETRWMAVAIAACGLGIGTKEILVTAPVMALFYDRTFLAGSFAAAWRERRGFYLGLLSSWLLLAYLLAQGGGDRAGTIGFGVGAAWMDFTLTQTKAVATYLTLGLWPAPLIFDYGLLEKTMLSDVWGEALVVVLLIGGTVVALRRAPVLGFAGAWFFGILAPVLLVPGRIQVIVEHRPYLSLAAVWMLVVAGLYSRLGRRTLLALCAIAVAFAGLTFLRNRVYRTERELWTDNVAKRPANARAHGNLGKALLITGELELAKEHLRTAIAMKPHYAKAHSNLGVALSLEGKVPEALEQFSLALRDAPNDVEIHQNYGDTLVKAGRFAEAVTEYRYVRDFRPDFADLQENNFGTGLMDRGRYDEAVQFFERAIQRRPDFAEPQNNLANALAHAGRMSEAMEHFQIALKLAPDDPITLFNLGNALLTTEHFTEAAEIYRRALKGNPRLAEAQNNLGVALYRLGEKDEAFTHFQEANRIDPNFTPAKDNLRKLKPGAEGGTTGVIGTGK
jgi:tetratricopeptide (TPR) repeat protein